MSQLLRELAGATCFCGRKKTGMQTFCGMHYHMLPAEMKSALYKRVGEGYEEAYAAAKAVFAERAPKRKEASASGSLFE